MHYGGRIAFGDSWTYTILSERLEHGHRLEAHLLAKDFDREALRELYGPAAIPLFRVRSGGALHVVENPSALTTTDGDILISLVDPEYERASASAVEAEMPTPSSAG